MINAYRHKSLANRDKTTELLALFGEFRIALWHLSATTHQELLNGDDLIHWRPIRKDTLAFETNLSMRQLRSAQNMTHAAVSSWVESLTNRVRELITGSDLGDDRKTVLYRINARHGWWAKSLEIPWIVGESGELVYCSAKDAETFEQTREGSAIKRIGVCAEDLALARCLAKNAQKHCRFPNLTKVDTLVLDSIVAKPTKSEKAIQNGRIGWWVKIATLKSGRPVNVPLETNRYFEHNHQGAKLNGVVQLHLIRGTRGEPRDVAVSLVQQTPDAPTRSAGIELGVDFGVRHALFATSDGQLLGRRMLARLAELDSILTAYAARLQSGGVPLKSDPYYRQLQSRISAYVTNEIGRLLNRIAARDGEQAVQALVVEKLDLRGGGLSRRMNRLVTRTGRSVLKSRLKSLTDKHGIAVHEVPSPYTSQQCSGCGYTHKLNRNGAKFRCRFCGLKLHADVNAARVIQSRRSRPTSDRTDSYQRGITLRLLDSRHRERWNLPVEEAVPGVGGDRDQSRRKAG